MTLTEERHYQVAYLEYFVIQSVKLQQLIMK